MASNDDLRQDAWIADREQARHQMDPLQELVQRCRHELGLTVREAARRCNMETATFNHHFGPRHRKRQELSDEQLDDVSAGLGIPLRELQAALIVAAGYVIDVRRFDLDVIASVLPAQISDQDRWVAQEEARALAGDRASTRRHGNGNGSVNNSLRPS